MRILSKLRGPSIGREAAEQVQRGGGAAVERRRRRGGGAAAEKWRLDGGGDMEKRGGSAAGNRRLQWRMQGESISPCGWELLPAVEEQPTQRFRAFVLVACVLYLEI